MATLTGVWLWVGGCNEWVVGRLRVRVVGKGWDRVMWGAAASCLSVCLSGDTRWHWGRQCVKAAFLYTTHSPPFWLTNLHIYAIIRYLLCPPTFLYVHQPFFGNRNANPTSTVGRRPRENSRWKTPAGRQTQTQSQRQRHRHSMSLVTPNTNTLNVNNEVTQHGNRGVKANQGLGVKVGGSLVGWMSGHCPLARLPTETTSAAVRIWEALRKTKQIMDFNQVAIWKIVLLWFILRKYSILNLYMK